MTLPPKKNKALVFAVIGGGILVAIAMIVILVLFVMQQPSVTSTSPQVTNNTTTTTTTTSIDIPSEFEQSTLLIDAENQQGPYVPGKQPNITGGVTKPELQNQTNKPPPTIPMH